MIFNDFHEGQDCLVKTVAQPLRELQRWLDEKSTLLVTLMREREAKPLKLAGQTKELGEHNKKKKEKGWVVDG